MKHCYHGRRRLLPSRLGPETVIPALGKTSPKPGLVAKIVLSIFLRENILAHFRAAEDGTRILKGENIPIFDRNGNR